MKKESTVIYGRNAVRASLLSGRAKKVYVASHLVNDSLSKEARSILGSVELRKEGEITRITGVPSHQGFAAIVDRYDAYLLSDLICEDEKHHHPLIVMLDGIEDPHNLGAIMRSVDAFGADGIVIKSKGNAPLNGTVAKVSTGAIEYVKVAMVPNLVNAIKELKKKGYWIVAADGKGDSLYDEISYDYPICLIVGSEGFGISRLLLENSDFVVRIPMQGHVNSLNASVSAGILLAHIASSRK